MKRDVRVKEVGVRSIDVGHFNTKYTIGRHDSGDDSQIQARVFTSLAPQVAKTQTIDSTGIARTAACIVGVDGADYWVGPGAANQARGSEPRFVNDDYCLSPKYYALMLGALNDMAQQEDAEHELVIEQLVLGLACLAAFKACSETGYWPDLSCNSTLEITPWQQFSPRQEWRLEPSGSL